MGLRGYYGIGIERSKTPANVGSMLRSAQAFNASLAFTIGGRVPYRRQSTDTTNATDHLPFIEFQGIEEFKLARPRGAQIVVVEVDGERDLHSFTHPPRALYVLGPEDGSVSTAMRELAQHTVRLPSRYCLNVAVTAAIVMHDRISKCGTTLTSTS